jgi:phosphoribosyl-ATP pyrophosphohydrolase/phosphoribosyl-AMP cyclohydrolase/histidinol dehydrogenase
VKPFRFRRLAPSEINKANRPALDEQTIAEAARIVRDVRQRGEPALREHAERLGDIQPGAPLVIDRPQLEEALSALLREDQDLLAQSATRIRAFAEAQRNCLTDLSIPVPGGEAGHTIAPVNSAGCYAPGGRFPLPSSVLMTAVTARAAGVKQVIVASPRPAPVTLAAAAVAGADALLAVGGGQAIAALAFGVGAVPPCDVVVGPGNRWVTAAKQIVAGTVAIDMLAGPSELVVLADDTADPKTVAADLLAQAEHDPDALPILVTLDDSLPPRTEEELNRQLADLPTAETARAALQRGYAVTVASPTEATNVCDNIAPEHLALHTANAAEWRVRLKNYGTLFVGARSAEAFGDYGVGPNHVLPTGGTARAFAGLSVFTFLRARTWLTMRGNEDCDTIIKETARFARLEGLEAHARSAEARR